MKAWKEKVLSVCVAIVVCSCSPAGEDMVSANAASGVGSDTVGGGLARQPEKKASVELQRKLQAAYSAASERFADDLVIGEGVPDPFENPRRRWNERLAKCADADCRERLMLDQLNRLQFASGRAGSPVVGVPWRNGAFALEDPAFEGSLSILPLIDDVLLVRVDASQRPDASWICSLIAMGRLGPDGVARMKSVDEEERIFELRQGGAGQVVLAAAGDVGGEENPCYPTGTMFGTYSATSQAEPPRPATK